VDLATQAASVGALADATRLALYEYVVACAEPVGREEAAAAMDLPLHTVRFHLDRLVEAGLLATEYRRLGGRSGPGAGRPSKLYRRAEEQVTVTLPSRKYDLVGHILASGVEQAATGEDLGDALEEAAARAGRESAEPGDLDTFTEALADLGFEPRIEDDTVLLANCPFDTLAKTHTELVCGINQAFVQGIADAVGCGVTACLEPEPGQCCVKGRLGS
jgi:predicted ArsR family transcriptional regulator